MTRLFCDANVLFAAAISPDGRSSALFALTGKAHVLLASSHVIEETRRNLVVRYLHAVQRFENDLRPKLKVVSEADADLVAWSSDQGLPAQDAPVLAAAVGAQADALATGDKTHFGHLFGKVVRGVRVMTLKDALALLSNG